MSHAITTEIKQSISLSLPLVAIQLIYAIGGFISTALVARCGYVSLATHAIVWATFWTAIILFTDILDAVSILVAQSYGAQDKNGIRQAMNQGFILAFFFLIPITIILWIAPYCLVWTGQENAIIQLSIPYFHSFIGAILPYSLLLMLCQFLLGIGKTRLVLVVFLFQLPLERFLFYVFMFGKWGFPKCGLAGIGYGMTTSLLLSFIILSICLYFSKLNKKYKILFPLLKLNKKYLFEIIRVGIPLGITRGMELALFMAIAVLMGQLGTRILAAHQIAYQCLVLSVTTTMGLSQGTMIRVGHAVGQNSEIAVRRAAYTNVGIGICFMLFFSTLYLSFPKAILSLDLNTHLQSTQILMHYAINFLFIMSIIQLVECIRLIFTGALRGLKDTKATMIISLSTFWGMAFPAAYILAFKLHAGGAGIWWGLGVGFLGGAIILLKRFRHVMRHIDLAALVTR